MVFGVPVLNGAAHLEEALESLLAQSYADFGILLFDNCSTDATPEIARRFAQRDARVRYRRGSETVGAIDNWRRTFRAAIAEFGYVEYFAFGGDHDLWHPLWLESLIRELDADDSAVLAFPVTVRIGRDGQCLKPKRRTPFVSETMAVADRVERVRRVAYLVEPRVPNAAYGLYRTRALERCRVWPYALKPDRLLMTQLAVLGTFRHVPRELWMRRTWKVDRPHSRHRLFTGRPPLHTHLHPLVGHIAILFRWLVIQGGARPEVSRARGVRILGAFVAATVPFLARSYRRKAAYKWQTATRRAAEGSARFR